MRGTPTWFVMAALLAVPATMAAQTPPGAPSASTIAQQDFHAACMDTEVIETRGTQPMGPVLAQIGALQNNRELAGVAAALERVGIDVVLPTGVPDAGTLPSRAPAYRRYIERLFTLMGDSPAQAAEETEAAIQVGTGLAGARQPGTHARIGLGELKQLAPNFNWTAYFIALGAPLASAGAAASPAYVQALNGMALVTPIESWKSYLRARWLDASAELLGPDFVAAHTSFYEPDATGGRARRCTRQQSRFTGDQYQGAAITRDDYFADTMRLRALRFADHLADQLR